ncbi:2-dehydro-3-deoxy-6-phosphogalactonate aldolase [Halomonas caseinilytica]|uniref:2-dehydro-3-deoxy-6-phosphogalactonate aldolase n=1 Tax=Halomonas caseinilytica TaxID=438744 RepID=UPI0007E5AE6C|nr:2-dehydro-3-deoxy-6-phosphogalactonate aldolase [Halomonas caseinilytica]SEN62027.1 2-keto-3-deoxy-phosphogalactonate aldolase [Halomonas caseinilytica]
MNETQRKTLDEALETLPLVAILRGITPEEVEDVCDALIGAGFRMIEIPLNSPRPWESIERAVAHCPASVLIGAGTVLEVADAERLERLGAPLMVTPNTDSEVVRAGVDHGLAPMIGCMTPSEALAAARSGARALKLFPAARLGTGYFKDISAILPRALPVLAVGGIDRSNMAEWHAVGVRGFGFGSNLYTPGRGAEEIAEIATDLVAEWRRLEARGSEG